MSVDEPTKKSVTLTLIVEADDDQQALVDAWDELGEMLISSSQGWANFKAMAEVKDYEP